MIVAFTIFQTAAIFLTLQRRKLFKITVYLKALSRFIMHFHVFFTDGRFFIFKKGDQFTYLYISIIYYIKGFYYVKVRRYENSPFFQKVFYFTLYDFLYFCIANGLHYFIFFVVKFFGELLPSF